MKILNSTLILKAVLLFLLFDPINSIACPSSYNSILNGCYKVNNGSGINWSDAKAYCESEPIRLAINQTNYSTHLVALESAIETTSLLYWLRAWSIQTQFWTDGIVASSLWSWSNQSVTWHFNYSEQAIDGNGTHYRLVYSLVAATYKVSDDADSLLSNFICEYQEFCSTNNSCQNGATCYLNVGRELCICAPGFTGTLCEEEIDECLSSPCQHGGICTDRLNNYTCDCSHIGFTGSNCENEKDDPTKGQRSAAFWSVFSVVISLVALLTISDLPWDDIAENMGCPWFTFNCCSKNRADEIETLDDNEFHPSDSTHAVDNQNMVTVSKGNSRGVSYHVMNTVWNPDQVSRQLTSNPQYNGYRSPDQSTTPDNILIQSFAAAVAEKQRQKKLEEKRVYAMHINDETNQRETPKNPAETMVTWTQQLQEQLKLGSKRETSASSTKQLIPPKSPDE